MAKSIYLTLEQYKIVREAALLCGFRVSRGNTSQLGHFVVKSAQSSAVSEVRRRLKNKEWPADQRT